ncbi:MAG: hypothetical protein C0511_14575 [Hyphomicrobium sp.]|nr:hypothetical protein [Hyphomicrobium sp.]
MLSMNFNMHQLKKRVLTHAVRLSTLVTVIAIVIVGGLVSSWYMVEAGFSLNTRTQGSWVMWTSAARVDADPYTRAHFARSGALPLSSEIAHTYLARADSDGLKLHSSCDYLIEATEFEARWWSMVVFDEHGRLIPNPTQRHAFTSDTIALSPSGEFTVTLGRDARPGNWLPTGGAGRLALVLTLIEPRSPRSTEAKAGLGLPIIRKVQCR